MSNYIDESQWVNPYHGLELNPGFQENSRDNENGILFYAQYLFLKQILNKLTKNDIKKVNKIISNIQTYNKETQWQIKGIYDRGAKESLLEEQPRTISRDNLLAISAISSISNLEYSTDICNYGIEHFWRFDNVNPLNPSWNRFMFNIPDIFVFLLLSNKKSHNILGYWGIPLVVGYCIYSALTKYKVRPAWYSRIFNKDTAPKRKILDTSGPLILFTILYALANKYKIFKFIWKLCSLLITKVFDQGWSEIFTTYYKNEAHPNRILSSEILEQDNYLF